MSYDGKVVISTVLDTKQAHKSAQGLSSTLKSGLAKGTKIATAGLAAMATAGTATAGAMIKATKQTVEYGDHVDKMSQKLGMSAKAYQQWDYVAKISGTSIDGLKMGFKTLTNTIDKANQGDKTAVENFNRVGMSIDDLKGKTKEDIFKTTVESLQKMSDETERSAMANKLLGRAGMELGPLLNSSKGSIEELMKKAEDYGMVMSDKAVKASAKFQDSLTTLQGTFTGLRNKMSAQFLPSLTKVTDGLSLVFTGDTQKGLKKIKEGIDEFMKKLKEITPVILKLGGTILKSLGKGILDNLSSILDAGTQVIIALIRGITRALPVLIRQLPKILGALTDALIGSLDMLAKELPSALGGLASVLSGVVKLFGGFLQLLTSTGAEGQVLRGALVGIVTALVAYKTATTVARIATQLMTASMNANPIILLASALVGAVVATVKLGEAMKDAFTYEDDATRQAEEASKQYEEFTKSLKENAKAREENISNARAQGNELDFLYDKLTELNKVEHKSKAQKEELKSVVKQLNEKLPDLKLRYDEEKDSLNKSTNAIKKNIEQRKKKIMVDALEENAKKIAEDRAKAEERYNESVKAGQKLEEKRATAEANRASLKAQADEASKKGNLAEEATLTAGIKALDWQIGQYEESIKANNNQTKKAKANLDDLSQKYDEAFVRIDNAQKKGKFDKLISSAKKAGVEVPASLKTGFETGEVSLKEATTRINNAMKFKDLNKGVKGKAKQTVDDIVNAYLAGTISAEEASKKLRDAGLKGLKGKGEEFKKSGESKKDKFKEGLGSDKKGVEKASKEGTVDPAKKGATDKKGSKKSGENFLNGFIDGLMSIPLLSNVIAAGKNIAKLALEALRKEGDEGSPWGTTEASGEFSVEGLIKGAEKRKGDVEKAYAGIAKSAISSFDKELRATTQLSAGSLQQSINSSISLQDGVRDAVKSGFEDANVQMKVGDRDFARLVKGA